jgi:hypothetical protein
MTDFSIQVQIQASPAAVWAVMGDVERWHEWTSTVTGIKKLDPGPLAVGTRLLIRQPKLPPAMWKVTALEEGKSFTSVTRSPGVRVTAHHRVEAWEGGSQTTLSLKFAGLLGPLVGRLTRSLNERYLAIEAKGLKERSEKVT